MVQIRPSSSARYTQHLANLGVRKPLYIMHHYHRPRTGLKLRERRLESLLQLARFSRIAEPGRNQFGELLGRTNLLASGQIERRIRDYSIEPGGERLPRIKPVERLIRAQKPFLHRVLSILMRQDDRSRHYVRAALMQSHKTRKTPFVALSGQTYELSLFIRNTSWGGQSLKGCGG
jgi:hypothetical protein